MFRRLSNSWSLVKASGAVLMADKELLIFPIISAIGTIVVSITFFIPLIVADFFDNLAGGIDFFGYVLLFLFYIVQYTVVFFCNTALVGAALIRLKGGDPTVADGFRIAWEHLGSILGYALIAATVGMILRWLSERSGVIGRFVTGLIGLAWNLATYLVVPVLVVEKVGPVEAIKRSATLLKKTWGEQIAGNLSIGLVFGLVFFLAILISIPVMMVVISTQSLPLIVGAAVVIVFAFIFIGLVNSALSGIYAAAVYRYAAEGDVGNYFDPQLVKTAFRVK